MNIKEILAKLDKGEALSAKEIAVLKANSELMSDAQRTKFAEVEGGADAPADAEAGDEEEEDEEGGEAADEEIDEKALRSLISKSSKEEIEKQFEGIADRIVAKFQSNLGAQRKKGATAASRAEAGRNETAEFMKALFENDTVTLRKMSAERAKAVTTTSGTSAGNAGYLIPASLEAEVLRFINVYGIARSQMRYLPFNGPGNSRTIPALGSGLTVSWTNEGVAKGSSAPAFNLVTQTLKKLAVIVPMTEEVLEDTSINLTELIGELIAEAMAREEDAQFLAGTGAVWTGVLHNTSTNQVALGTGEELASGDLRPEDLQAVIDATPSAVLRSGNAKWYMHPSVLGKIRMLRENTDGTGAMIFNSLSEGNQTKLLGYEVITSDVLPTAAASDAASEKFLFFGDLKMGAIYGDKQGMRVRLLTEATVTDTDGSTDINLAEQDMVAVRAVHRVGYVMALPTAITVLKNGPAA